MKDAVITIRVPAVTRKRIERLARREGRSLSQQAERLIERGMAAEPSVFGLDHPRGVRSLAGTLSGGLVPSLEDFRASRRFLAASLTKRAKLNAERSR